MFYFIDFRNIFMRKFWLQWSTIWKFKNGQRRQKQKKQYKKNNSQNNENKSNKKITNDEKIKNDDRDSRLYSISNSVSQSYNNVKNNNVFGKIINCKTK